MASKSKSSKAKKRGEANQSEDVPLLGNEDKLGSAGPSGTTTSAGQSGTTTSAGQSGTTTSAGQGGATTSENTPDLATGDRG